MAKPNPSNNSDYDYTDNLSDHGWAWELLRRSKNYRDTYDQISSQINEQFDGKWTSQRDDCFYPPKLPDESDADWAIRVDGQGYAGAVITQSQFIARDWFLAELYDYKLNYDPERIFFVGSKQTYPAFYSSAVALTDEMDKSERQRLRLILGNPKLRKLRPSEELLQAPEREDIVYIAIDASKPLLEQMDDCKAFMDAYQKNLQGKKYLKQKIQKSVLRKYLRYLDANNDNPSMTPLELYNSIIPENSVGRNNLAASSQLSATSAKTLRAAKEHADWKYRFLIGA